VLLALVPVNCCADHMPVAAPSCHEEQAYASDRECVMRGHCGGPMSALLSLLSAQAVLTAPCRTAVDTAVFETVIPTREQLVTRFVPPDSPPPRA
jgi:hypothetical protein